ncbi:MAG: hypothetical protein L6W00_01665 [Lentisphaeria bacterium]|nr:MAG: hypothetical protein L6W00_01665 [Lentisphaeria bacterium]
MVAVHLVGRGKETELPLAIQQQAQSSLPSPPGLRLIGKMKKPGTRGEFPAADRLRTAPENPPQIKRHVSLLRH